MLAVSAEYRLGKEHGTTPFECVAAGKSAVRRVRAQAAELGIDPERINMMTFGLGSHHCEARRV